MAAPAVRAAGGRAKTPFRWRARRHGVVRSAADAEAVAFRSMNIKLSSRPKPQSVALPIIRTDTKVKRSMCSDPAVAALTFRWDRRGAQLSPEWGRPDAAVQARGAPVHAMRGGTLAVRPSLEGGPALWLTGGRRFGRTCGDSALGHGGPRQILWCRAASLRAYG